MKMKEINMRKKDKNHHRKLRDFLLASERRRGHLITPKVASLSSYGPSDHATRAPPSASSVQRGHYVIFCDNERILL